MYVLCCVSVDAMVCMVYIRYVSNSKPIVDPIESPSQEEGEPSRADDGLRILGRIIARELLSKRSSSMQKNDIKAQNPQRLAGK